MAERQGRRDIALHDLLSLWNFKADDYITWSKKSSYLFIYLATLRESPPKTILKSRWMDFPGVPVAKTLCSQCRGVWV